MNGNVIYVGLDVDGRSHQHTQPVRQADQDRSHRYGTADAMLRQQLNDNRRHTRTRAGTDRDILRFCQKLVEQRKELRSRMPSLC